MILSGLEIKKEINKNIFIEPFNESQLNPNSYNLRLDNKLLVYGSDEYPTKQQEVCIDDGRYYKSNCPSIILDMKKPNPTKEIIIPEEGYVIYPGLIYLAKTVERTKTFKYVPFIEGRSSIARLGLQVHITAGFGDVGFDGYWTLELQCAQPIRIYPNVEVCQIYYHEMKGEHIHYSSKYNHNNDVQASMLYKDFE